MWNNMEKKPSGVAASQAMATDIGRTLGDRLLRDTQGWVEGSPHTAIRVLQEEVERLRAERLWIPVSDRLPEDGQSVVVFWSKYRQVGEAVFGKDEGWFSTDRGGCYEVSHWMPLPAPPEAK
jgi:hypothetical protein